MMLALFVVALTLIFVGSVIIGVIGFITKITLSVLMLVLGLTLLGPLLLLLGSLDHLDLGGSFSGAGPISDLIYIILFALFLLFMYLVLSKLWKYKKLIFQTALIGIGFILLLQLTTELTNYVRDINRYVDEDNLMISGTIYD